MAEICCGVVSKREAAEPCEPSSRAARRRRMLLRRIKSVDGAPTVGSLVPTLTKRQKVEPAPFFPTSELYCGSAIESSAADEEKNLEGDEREKPFRGSNSIQMRSAVSNRRPSFGFTSLCGRRRDMEDAVSFHPFFSGHDRQDPPALHFFGVFDGHGCSHVAKICKDRMHGLVAEELGRGDVEWEEVMKRSFSRMDKEVAGAGSATPAAKCRCELQTPRCDAVGSTAVVAVVSPVKIVVANCGDSRAVLCRSGKPVPLSSDHKPDRPDELQRIEAAGGRVIFWDGPRVLGVLAMSRAIGDSYLKPYVSSLPEVTVTDRSFADDCLILASDGLWDVVSNDTACDVARMCLRGQAPGTPAADGEIAERDGRSDKACSDAAMLLTKLALARRSTDNVSVIVVDLRMYT